MLLDELQEQNIQVSLLCTHPTATHGGHVDGKCMLISNTSSSDAPPIFYRKVATVQNIPHTLSTCQYEDEYREALICSMIRAARQ